MLKGKRMADPAPTLLLVEDETLIRLAVEDDLTAAGYAVVAVASGTEAFEEMGEDVSSFRAVITDIRLGAGPDGWDVARRARQIASEIPIVYMSGDSSHDWSAKGVPRSVMLAKPFAAGQVVTAVSTLINEADSH